MKILICVAFVSILVLVYSDAVRVIHAVVHNERSLKSELIQRSAIQKILLFVVFFVIAFGIKP